MDNKKALIGAILGIALIGLLIWFLFFRKKQDGKAIINILPSKEPDKPSQPQKQVVYVSGGGSSTATFPLRQGSRGNEVKLLQEALNKAGYDVGTADGVWGNKTQTAFQKAFPNKLGINDLADLEKTLASLSKSSSSTNTNANNNDKSTEPVHNPDYAGRYLVRVRMPIKLYYKDVGIFDHLEVGETITLTGRWARDSKGNIWVEYERPLNRGMAWTYSYYLMKLPKGI